MGEERKPRSPRCPGTSTDCDECGHQESLARADAGLRHPRPLQPFTGVYGKKRRRARSLINQAYQTLGDFRVTRAMRRDATALVHARPPPRPPPVRPSSPARGPAAARSRQDPRGPQSLISDRQAGPTEIAGAGGAYPGRSP